MTAAPKETKAKEITAKTIKAVLQKREKGKRIELTDARCKGLQFRVTEDGAANGDLTPRLDTSNI
ncbi:hypothetical protein [Bradyrhizobium canariense]|uniref:hypothetical protein n=1 Tax=Bradyrhizobium canariense TaxID=255045 RepID=UPI001B8A3BF0|nr:hypothetical protein [Bradyrhizobium canariense]MBR0952524.1 hypothetical protein [Bradyrhizobium canariense]